METQEKIHHIRKFGIEEQKQFTIKASAKAFKILSDGLYKDKIKAPIRELACNAYDAHVESGQSDRPFEVHLPNSLEPFFSVTDYGRGLSREEIVGLYTTYFDSTKTRSNDYIGCLGLGSKSPFAYTSSFIVESRQNGEINSYTCYIDNDGIPNVSFINSLPTTQEDGLTVKFAVKNTDFAAFKEKAQEVYKWFEIKPIVQGNKDYTLVYEKVLTSGKDWTIYEPRKNAYGSYGTSESYAVMGNVAYPLNKFPGSIATPSRNLINLNLIIHFKLGELDVAASREELSFDTQTQLCITEKLKNIISEISEVSNAEINKQNTLYAAWIAHKNIIESLGPLKDLVSHTWNSKILTSKMDFPGDNGKFKLLQISQSKKYTGRLGYTTVTRTKEYSSLYDSFPLYWKDSPTEAIREYARATKESLYLIVPSEKETTLKDFLNSNKEFTSDDIKLSSSVAPKASRGPRTKIKTASLIKDKVYEFVHANSTAAYKYWKEVDSLFNPTQDHYYVVISNKKPFINGGYVSPERVSNLLFQLNNYTNNHITLYGVKTDYKNIPPNWISFDKFISEFAKKESEAFVKNPFSSLYTSYSEPFFDNLCRLKVTSKEVDKFLQNCKQAKKTSEIRRKLTWLLRDILGTNSSPYKAVNDIKPTEVPELEKYPLLKYIDFYTVDKKTVQDYIDLIDSTNP